MVRSGPLTTPFGPRVLLVVIAITAAVFYAAAWREAPVVDGDSAQYMEVARDLQDFRLDDIHDRSPGYPLLIRLTGAGRAPTRGLFYASLALHTLAVLLLVSVLAAAGLGFRWRLLFCVLASLPPLVEPAAVVMTENLAECTLVVGVSGLLLWLATQRPSLLVISALGFAYGGLTRPSYQIVGVVVAVALVPVAGLTTLLSWREVRRAALALVIATVLLVGGLSAYHARQFGFLGVAPTLGFHLTTKTILFVEYAPDEFAVLRDILVDERARELVAPGGLHDGSQTIWNARARLQAVTGLDTPALSARLLRMNIALVRRMPQLYLRDVAQASARYWLPVYGRFADFGATPLRLVWTAGHGLLIVLLALQVTVWLGVAVSRRIGVWPAGAARSPFVVTRVGALAYSLALLIVGYTMAVTCVLDIGEPRQRRATDLLILFACVIGLHVWRQSRVVARGAIAGPTPAATVGARR